MKCPFCNHEQDKVEANCGRERGRVAGERESAAEILSAAKDLNVTEPGHPKVLP